MSSPVRWLVLLITTLAATAASAQFTVPFPKQNANGPIPPYRQDAFPYPGQCTSNPTNGYVGGPPLCSDSAYLAQNPSAASIPAAPPLANGTLVSLPATAQPKFQFEVPNPVDFTPEVPEGSCSATAQACGTGLAACPTGETCIPKYHYYELAIAKVKNLQAAASLGVFPDPTKAPNTAAGQTAGAWTVGAAIPDGKTWTGIVNPATKAPLYTDAWGFGQINSGGGPLAALAGTLPPGIVNPADPGTAPVVTWPAMSLRSQRGTPMIVKFVNQLPDQHLFCPYPLAWDWPCAIDRTLMGVKASVDPLRDSTSVPADGVNQFGSPQQPDNAWTIHLHGGEIPPQSDGFAEKWFGNANSGAAYSAAPRAIDPIFEAPYRTIGHIERPGGVPQNGAYHAYDRMTYYYPMVQDEALLWYHDHALGKTRINVAAGPAGFAPTEDPASPWNAALAPLRARNGAGIPMYDLFLAIQDRAFDTNGSINFPTGLGQAVAPLKKAVPPPGATPVTPGNNPQVHPQWVGEYFADHITVNGVIWPKITVVRGIYRIRLLNGSNARCYQFGLGTVAPVFATPAAAGTVTRNVGFTVIADEQGYLPVPAPIAPTGFLQMCPGERYEILVDFSAVPAGSSVWMTNTAAAPFPVGITPQQKGSMFAQTAAIVRFDVRATGGRGETTPVTAISLPATTNAQLDGIRNMPACTNGGTSCYSAVRQMYLNERIDGTTLTSLGLQINGVPFEYKVTETPKQGTYERWDIVNTTGDFHPMHLHLVKFLVVKRQAFAIGAFTQALCGANKCGIFGGGAGNMMQVVPDVNLFYGTNLPIPPGAQEYGWKDTVQAPPGQVTTVIAKWDGSWTGATATGPTSCTMNFPGVEAYSAGAQYEPSLPLCFEPVTNAPYVWHCHIVDHEDAEMMRSSLVMK